jgi:hypothetical protein
MSMGRHYPGAPCVSGDGQGQRSVNHDWLAWRSAICHSVPMARRSPASGGIFLFLGPVLGALYGIGRGEPILWMLYGFGAGIAIALLIWLRDRSRT